MQIRSETDDDREGIRHVNQVAFGQDDEANLVDALRTGNYVVLSLVAEIDGRLVGHILFSELPIRTSNAAVPALSLAPMAVLPDYQRRGIGSELVRCGLELCRNEGHRIVVVLGHSHFYPKFGFSSELARPLKSQFSGEVWMALELVPEALAGVAGSVCYPPPFGLEPVA